MASINMTYTTRMTRKPPKNPIKTTGTIFDIIEYLDEQDGAGVTEIAETFDKAPSTIHSHLQTLVARNYLIKDGTTYRNGLKFLQLGTHVERRIQLSEEVQPFLERAAEETNELAWFVVEEHGRAVYLDKVEGKYAVQPYTQKSEREDIHNIAAGKAILAHLPDERVKEIIDRQGLPQYTEKTITDIEELHSELGEIRERGYAFNRGETFENHRAVACPILHGGEVRGSIVVSGPKNRLKDERFNETIPELLSGIVNAIELELTKKSQDQF